jgi:hypothetical protein
MVNFVTELEFDGLSRLRGKVSRTGRDALIAARRCGRQPVGGESCEARGSAHLVRRSSFVHEEACLVLGDEDRP